MSAGYTTIGDTLTITTLYATSIILPVGAGSINIGNYGSLSETQGGLAFIIGNSIKASPTINNTVVKSSNDPGIFFRQVYNVGATVHTNLLGATGTTFVDTENEMVRFGLNGTTTLTQYATLGATVLKVVSTATNDDPTVEFQQNRIATTDATVTQIHAFAVVANYVTGVSGKIIARRTGGAAGTADDGAYYTFDAVYNHIAGTATLIGAATITPIGESQAAWNVTLVVVGTNVEIRVTGALNNNITWHLVEFKLFSVGS